MAALEAAGPPTSGKAEVEHAMVTEEWHERAHLREKGKHVGDVYHGSGAEDVEWEAARPLMKLNPAVHAQVVYAQAAPASASLVLR